MYALGVAKPYRFRERLFYSFVVLGGLVLRYPGAATGARLGNLARHALGWFSATIGAAITILVINGIDAPQHFIVDVKDGLAAASLIYGLGFGAAVEVGTSFVEALRAETGTSTDR